MSNYTVWHYDELTGPSVTHSLKTHQDTCRGGLFPHGALTTSMTVTICIDMIKNVRILVAYDLLNSIFTAYWTPCWCPVVSCVPQGFCIHQIIQWYLARFVRYIISNSSVILGISKLPVKSYIDYQYHIYMHLPLWKALPSPESYNWTSGELLLQCSLALILCNIPLNLLSVLFIIVKF